MFHSNSDRLWDLSQESCVPSQYYCWKQCLALGMSWMFVVKVTGQWTSLLFLHHTPVQLEELECSSEQNVLANTGISTQRRSCN